MLFHKKCDNVQASELIIDITIVCRFREVLKYLYRLVGTL